MEARLGSLPSYRSGLKISASSSSSLKEISEPLGSMSLWDIHQRIRGFCNNNVVGSFLADSGNFQIEKAAAIEDEDVIEEEELACEDTGAFAKAPWRGCDEVTGNDSGEVRGFSHLDSSLVCDEVAAELRVERLKMTKALGQIWKSKRVGRVSFSSKILEGPITCGAQYGIIGFTEQVRTSNLQNQVNVTFVATCRNSCDVGDKCIWGDGGLRLLFLAFF